MNNLTENHKVKLSQEQHQDKRESLLSIAKAQAYKIDAKSILLKTQTGEVQMPTTETVSLLGARTTKILTQQSPSQADGVETGLMYKFSSLKAQKRTRLHLNESAVMEVSMEMYRCSFSPCKKVFKSKQNLKNHMAYHKSRTNFICPVDTCQKTFNYRHNLTIHMRVHNDTRPYECPQKCGKSFRTKGNMMDHLRRHYAIK